MNIFEVDYIRVVWQLLVPPDKRQPVWLAWGRAVMKGKQWLHHSIFKNYVKGSSDASFDPAASYTVGNRVIYYIQSYSSGYTSPYYYGDNAVYECIYPCTAQAPEGSNVVPDVPPPWVVDSATALTWLATGNNANPFYWVRVTNNFIGANERVTYSAQKLIFEYALNRWFNTTFRQPIAGISDIFIGINSNTTNQFFLGKTRDSSYFAPATNVSDKSIPFSKFFTPGNSFLLKYDFSIHVPVPVYNALINTSVEGPIVAGSNSTLRDAVVHAFADILNPAGSYYNVITY